jgi:hypothetical protein
MTTGKIALSVILFVVTTTLAARNIVLPAGFDWKTIPPQWEGKTVEIRHHFRTDNIHIILPEKVTLLFKEGSLIGPASITANNTTIKAPRSAIFDTRTQLSGSFVNTTASPEWFGAAGDNRSNDANAVKAAINAFHHVHFSKQYHIPGVQIVIEKPAKLTGTKNALIRGDGSSAGRFIVKNSLSVSNLSFSGFRFCFLFDHNDVIDGVEFIGNRFSSIEKPIYASNSNLRQKILRVNISGNTFTECTSGVELLAWVRYVSVCHNTFTRLGSPQLEAQANAIRIGNTAFNLSRENEMGDVTICGNHIHTVRCGINRLGNEGFECHGVFVTGNRVEISNNHIENVFNGGVGSNPRNKTGSEGIYVKANDCIIRDNTLINAGFGEGAICAKDFSRNITISGNTIQYTQNEADHSQLITCYYAGTLIIEKNLLGSVAVATTAFKISATGTEPSVAIIRNNPSITTQGYLLKILNKSSDAVIRFENNPSVNINDMMLKEESSSRYTLLFHNNTINANNALCIPSSQYNNVTFTHNNLTLRGTGRMCNLWNTTRIENNRFTIEASNPSLPLLNIRSDGPLSNNLFVLNGQWRNVLVFSGNTSAEISGNQFSLTPSQGHVERVIFINTSTPGLSITLQNNSFSGNAAARESILISISNAGLNHLTLNNNTSGENAGVMLEILSAIQTATFTQNKTDSPAGLVSQSSLARISGKYRATGNSTLPDTR